MKHLTLIANKNCTDKGTSYREAHGFTEIYEDYIKKFIGKHPRILEIGIENGGSLKMWNDYFLGDCEIYAIDILPEKKMFEKHGQKCPTCVCGAKMAVDLSDEPNPKD